MSVAVVMPAWNEVDGIEEFIRELHEHLGVWSPRFVVVDDCSTDTTVAALERLREQGFNIEVHKNTSNMGHGPSTIRALQLGLNTGADHIIAVDGDGQFLGEDVLLLLQIAATGIEPPHVIEGVRSGRQDAVYRKALSAVTKILVWLRTRSTPIDANTPLRIYQRQVLVELLEYVPTRSLIPNLHISALVRELGFAVRMAEVRSRVRRGSNSVGSTWGTVGTLLPNRRLIKFCLRAAQEWLGTSKTQRQTES